MWINIGDPADTNDSDNPTVDKPVAVCGREILLNRLLACPYRDPPGRHPGPRPGISPPMPHSEIPACAGMTICTIRTVPTSRIVDNGSLHARIRMTPARHPGPRPGISPPMPHSEIPACAGMTICIIRRVRTSRVVDNGSLHARLGIPTLDVIPGPDPGSHHQRPTPRSRRAPG